jgi:hypothetical protein
VDFHILSKCLNWTETINYLTIETTLPTTLTTNPEVNHIVYRNKIHYDMLSSLQANCTDTDNFSPVSHKKQITMKPLQTFTPK